MKRTLLASCSILLGLWSGLGSAAEQCKHPYEKTLPYNLPIGGDKAYVAVHSQINFTYDCKSLLAQAEAGVFASFLNLDLDLLNAQGGAYAGTGTTPATYEDANAYARVTVLGYEIAREDLDLGTMVDIHPSHDIDFSDSLVFNVGPIPVPVKYGVEGAAGLGLKAGIKGFGIGADIVPDVTSRAYVQAGLDVGFAKAIASGDLIVLNDTLKNKIQLGLEDAETLGLRVNATSTNQLEALEGAVRVSASATGLGKGYDRVLFDWPGYAREDFLFDFSDRVDIVR